MKNINLIAVTLLSTTLFACNSSDSEEEFELNSPRVIDFSSEDHGFTSIFSDYPQGEEEFYQLTAAHETLPADFAENKGWKLSGNNHSDDLIMAIKGQVANLESETLYKVSIEAEMLTNVPSNCVGIGGAPGESVYVKLAASTNEPANSLENDYHRISTDIGSQSNSGTEGLMVGNIANGIECGEEEAYKMKTLATETTIDVTSDSDGTIWVMAATDSGFEGPTTVYFTKLTVTITE